MAQRHNEGTSKRERNEKTRRLHFQMVRFMFEAGAKLRLPSVPMATAVTIYHRFFRDYDITDFDTYMIATTALYLAGKIEEQELRLTDVINVCHRILHPSEPPLDIGATYTSLRESIIQCELFLMRALGFQVCIVHPHKYLVHYLKSLYDWLDKGTIEKVPIVQTSWAILRDSYHSDLCLDYSPSLVAVAVIYLTLSCYGVEVPYNEESEYRWWEAFIPNCKLRDVKRVAEAIMNVYDMETTAFTTETR